MKIHYKISERVIKIHDIETLLHMFCYVDYDLDSGLTREFVLHKDRDDWKGFMMYLTNLVATKHVALVGYNNLSFDGQVIEWIIQNQVELSSLDVVERIEKIHGYAQECIRKSNANEFPDYQAWKMSIYNIDLFKIWHYDNRARATSLKWCEFSMDHEDVREMPIEHDGLVTKEMIGEVLAYCRNDVMATKKFYDYTIGDTDHKLYKGIDKIQLRANLRAEFNTDFTNYNDVKIGDEINKIVYAKNIGKHKRDLPKTGTFRKEIRVDKCIPSYIRFNSTELTEFLERLRKLVLVGTKGEFSEEITYKGVKFTIAQGGIHSVDKPRIISPTKSQILEDRDCALDNIGAR